MNHIDDIPFVVIDLGSGRYLNDNIGNEIFNETPNPITQKYYGYAPPRGNIVITKLGARRKDDSVSGVIVIYVKCVEGSKDRYISSFIPNATIYAKPQIDKSLRRRVSNTTIDIPYSIESDEIFIVDEITSERFIIMQKDFSNRMFRSQRFYKGKYPDLDKQIIAYIESVISKDAVLTDAQLQEALQDSTDVSIDKISLYAHKIPQCVEGVHGAQVRKKVCVSKAALIKADFTCESSSSHFTFASRNGHQYMEGHHLIPCTPSNAKHYWERFHVNIDCIENIVSLCPTCHRCLHYGSEEDRKSLLTKLYAQRQPQLNHVGLAITLSELISLYATT